MEFPSRAIRHDRTSVLLLSWDPLHDDLKVGKEVGRLKAVFEDIYGFKVCHKFFDMQEQKKTQHQASMYLSNFVYEEDVERGLLIIYYAGHGYSDAETQSGDMKLIGRRTPVTTEEAQEAQDKQEKRTSIVWSKVEPAIQNTDADVLLIFDCCHAGRLCYTRSGPDSYFEFLGACAHHETTRGPGDESFTSALIWALKQLAKKEEAFNTSELRRMITKYPRWPPEQIPVLADRVRSGDHIFISRKGLEPGSAKQAPSKSEREQQFLQKEFIDLRFHFDGKVSSDHFVHTADALKLLKDANKATWERVAFQGKFTQHSVVERYARRWRESVSRKKSISNISPIGPPPPLFGVQVESPKVERTLTPQIPTQPLTPAPSTRPSRSSSIQSRGELAPLLSRRPESRRRHSEDETIAYHVKGIARRLRTLLGAAFAWLACKVSGAE